MTPSDTATLQETPHAARAPAPDTRHADPAPNSTELTRSRVITLLPAELLQNGEAIVLLLKPSLWYIVLEPLGALSALTAIVGSALWLANRGYNIGFSPRDLLLMGIGMSLVVVFWHFLEWLSRVYVLTDRRVIRVKGVVNVHVFEAQLQHIQHTHTTFSLRERLFGVGSIHFATAGTGSTGAAWVMIAKPLEVHNMVVQTLNRYR